MKTPPGLAPFNLKDALEKKRPVVHENGRKVVAVYHLPEADPHSKVAIIYDGGSVFLYTENGENYPGEMPVLFHPAEPVLVPFDLANWQAGWKAVYRDGSEPAGVVKIQRAVQPIISVTNGGGCYLHELDGKFDVVTRPFDLFLIKPEGQA